MQASITWHNGSPDLTINGDAYLPVSYRSFYPQSGTVKNFYEKDFSLYHLFPSGILCSLKIPYSQCGEVWDGEGVYNWDNLRKHIDMFLGAAPEAKFSLLVQLDTRDWYLEEHPEAFDSFHNLALMCRDEGWRRSATRFLKDIIEFVEREYPERVYCLHLFAGHTCEWYAHYPQDGLPESEQLTKSYQDYFSTQDAVPTHEELLAAHQGVFRHPKENKKALEFWDFYNEIIAETICYFAKQAKQITDRRLLTGCFYGYTMVFSHAYQRGHNAYHTVLNCPDIDMIFAPAAYRSFRGMDGTSGFNLAVDSVRFHKKLYMHEIDNTTSLTTGNAFADAVQGPHQRPESLADDVTYCRRETARVLEHGGGYWWFDMWNGWFDDPTLMQELQKIKTATKQVYDAGTQSVSEIAVFVDADSAKYLAGPGNRDAVYINNGRQSGPAVQYYTVHAQQQELHKLGAPVSYYDARDLLHPDFPHQQYKLYIFPNLYAPSDELKAAIDRLRTQGKSCLFLYAPGYIGKEDFSLEAMHTLTGFDFALAERETEGTIYVCDSNLRWGGGQGISPLFTVCEDNSDVLARYCQSGLSAGCIKRRGNAVDAWFGCGPVPASVLRQVAKQAGVFIWHDGDDPIYVNQGMLGMYCQSGGERKIRLPEDCRLVSLYEPEELCTKDGEVTIAFQPKEYKLFLRQ